MLKMEKEVLPVTDDLICICVRPPGHSRFQSSSLVGEACRYRFLNWFDVYLNPYCRPALTTITGIFLRAKVTMKIVCLVFSSTMHKACIFLDTFISRYLKTDFYEII